MLIPSGRSVTARATARPGIAALYFGIRNESSKSWSHLRGQDQSSSEPSSVPIAMALRPTAERYIPGRADPLRARGESPSEKYGMVVAVSRTAPVTAGGAPGARGGG